MKKKLIATLLILSMAFALSACGGGGEKKAESDKPTTTENTEKTETKKETKGGEIVLNQPIEFKDFTITIKSFSVVKDYDGNPVLKMVYDWENTGEDADAPFLTFTVKGFQDGVQTDDMVISESIDLGIGQKEVKPGGIISDAEEGIGITAMDKPFEIEIATLMNFDDENVYKYTIDDLNQL